MAVLQCDSCGGDTFEPLKDAGYFRCHHCGAPGSVKLVTTEVTGAGLWLLSPGPKKINVIKVLRAATGWDLARTKGLADAAEHAPQAVPVPSEMAERLAIDLTAAGAQVRRG
jgi:ribosomal protein L7/L12